MGIPENISMTVYEARQAAATTAVRMGIPFNTALIETIDDVLADIILEAALGPQQNAGEGAE